MFLITNNGWWYDVGVVVFFVVVPQYCCILFSWPVAGGLSNQCRPLSLVFAGTNKTVHT